uniref:ATP synthase F0 subunit 8 n=1 Tax=Orseolia oryzae TaxID=33408 RepID=A0A0K0M783_9DIPT|nr:ATP synthase F0 subunit 8 [Orseolia oryzae]
MKPMNWLFLYFLINLILMFMNIMNYFFFKFSFMNNLIINNKIYLNWKW